MKRGLRTAWTVARRELLTLFDQPTGYILLVVFVAVNDFLCFRQIELYGVATLRPMLDFLPWLLLFLVPAVTMRALAEDARSGTLEVVLAQPVTELELVLGKYVGALLFLWIALGLTLPIPLGLALGAPLQPGVVFAQYVGSALLTAGIAGVGLAQAILHRPDLLVLDEPTEGLDPNQRVEIRQLIGTLGRDRTVLLSTHVLSEVQQSCSRLLIISRGKIVADGPVDRLIERASGAVEIAVEAAGDGIAQALRGLPGARNVAVARTGGDGRVALTLTADRSADLRPEIFALAKARGWTLYELHQETGSLEELFRQLTAGGDA